MPTFRNRETGHTISLKERWADKLRQQPELYVELTPEGSEVAAEPSPVLDTDPALKRLRLADLQALLAEQGKSTEGTKAQLLARLNEPASVGEAGASLPSPDAPDPEG